MSNYEVGYRKPPAEHRFKKGQSGNPKGRPRRLVSTDDAEILRRLDDEEIVIGGREMTMREAEIRVILSLAIKRDRKAKRLIERLARSIPRQNAGGVLRLPWDEFRKVQN